MNKKLKDKSGIQIPLLSAEYRAEMEARFRSLPLSDDFMFAQVMTQKKICKAFLENLLGKRIAKLRYVHKQKHEEDAYGWHGVRLDIYLTDENGTKYNIEMQKGRRDDIQRRTRYYQAVMDRKSLHKGADYSDLPESFVIFVCDYDLFAGRKGGCKAKYELTSCFNGDEDLGYYDGRRLIVLNSRYKTANVDESIEDFLKAIGGEENEMKTEFGNDIRAALDKIREDDEIYDLFMVTDLKLRDREKDAEARGLEKGLAKGMAKGMAKGIEKGRAEDAYNMKREGLPLDLISRVTGLEISAIEAM